MLSFFERMFTIGFVICLFASAALAQIGFDPAVNYATGDMPESVALGDYNNDGDLDFAVTTDNQDKVSVFFNQGDGTFGAGTDYFLPSGSGVHSVVALNLDGDADLDLAVSLQNSNAVHTLFNNGSGVFSLGSSFGTGLEPRFIAAGDLDGMNGPDVVTGNRDGNSVSVLLNNGSGSFGAAANHATGQEPRGVTLGDFDGSNGLDIAVSAHDDREINLFLNNGSGSFSAGATLSVGAQLRPEGLVAADLDNDNDVDIAASTEGNGQSFASVFVNNGAGSFSGPVNYAIGGVDPSDITAADFDLDGLPDLATANSSSSNVSALPGTGGSIFGGSSEFGVGTAPQQLAAGDLDGNGSSDLVVANQDSDTVSVLINVNSVPLVADVATISAASGGVVNFSLSAGPTYAGRSYILAGTTSGTSPGYTLLNGNVIPLNRDWFTDWILDNLNNAVLVDFFGSLDGNGDASATLNAPFPLPAFIPPGTILHFAFTTITPTDFQSNAVGVEVVP